MSVRLATRDGRALPPDTEAIAFAFANGHAVASRNGVEVPVMDAVIALAECMNQHIQDIDALTARAISEPGALR